ncbi:MAG: hypothetical protein JSS79_15110 [Bacteroidetes bacterium]|nr:hypothetical protein [Bacteroidota bacterium]
MKVRLSKYVLISVVALLINFNSLSQSVSWSEAPIIKIDSVLRRPDSQIPFDRIFILQMDIDSTAVIESVMIGKASPTDISLKGFANVRFEKHKTTLYLFMEALTPTQEFNIYIFKRLAGKELASLIKLNAKVLQKEGADHALDSTAKDAFVNEYFALFDQIEHLPRINGEQQSSNGVTFKEYKQFLDDKLGSHYRATISELEIKTIPIFHDFDPKDIKEILLTSNSYGLKVQNTNSLFQLIDKATDLTSIAKGVHMLGALDHKTNCSEFELDRRTTNLAKSISLLSDFIEFFKAAVHLEIKEKVSIEMESRLTKLKEALENNKKLIDKKAEEINDLVTNNSKIRYGNWVFAGSNINPNIITSSGYKFTPEIGIATVLGYDHGTCYPMYNYYVGVNFNFLPIDNTIRLKKLPNKSFKKKASVLLGVTMNKIQTAGFSDLVNNSYSLLLGLNYRTSSVWRWGLGSVIMQKNSSIVPGFYISTSIDIGFLGGVSSVTDKIFK